jgi:exonuclease III
MNITPNNNNPPPTSSYIYPFRLATLNIQGLNSTIKQKQLIEMLELEHISVIGLSETKIPKSQSKFIYKHLPNFTTYFDNDSVSPMGSGVGIIISNDYNKYIHRHKGYKGRVYHIDLFMKGHVKMRIIQTYLHANISNNRSDIEDIHSYIFQLLESARKDNYHTILMGDFNVRYEEYKRDYQRKGSFHWSYNIFHQIKHKFNMKDGIKLYHSITPQNRMNTFHPVQPNKSSTCIDYIWISRSLVMESLTSGTFTANILILTTKLYI